MRVKTAREAGTARAKARAAKTGKRPAAPSDAPHRKAEYALRDHPAPGRWLNQHPTTGRLSIDAAKATAEIRLDGKYLLATSDPDPSAEDVALGYKNLLEAERAFRTMKSPSTCGRSTTASTSEYGRDAPEATGRRCPPLGTARPERGQIFLEVLTVRRAVAWAP